MQSSLSLYIHFPWCIQKCPYCDFNSHTLKNTLPEQQYVDRLIADLHHDLERFNLIHPTITSIFLGGGTPSLFSPQALETLFDSLYQHCNITADTEITLEANPGTVDAQYFKGYKTLGINRISLGIQSFNPEHLKALGRIHNTTEAIRAFEIARQAGFDNINIDLMFALPQQTPAQLQQDLKLATLLAPEHISYYQLTLEPNTLFAKHPPILPNDEISTNMQEQVIEALKEEQYNAYEVSNYTREKPCQHNLNYWQFGDYLGIGAGAHGKISTTAIYRTLKHKHPSTYLTLENSLQLCEPVASKDLLFEFMLNSLRLMQATTFDLLYQRTGLTKTQILSKLQATQTLGLLSYNEQSFQPTALGYRFLNDLQAIFLDDD